MRDTIKIKYNQYIKKWQVVKIIGFHPNLNFEEILYSDKDRDLCRLFKQNIEIK